jgi:hypothetical protein
MGSLPKNWEHCYFDDTIRTRLPAKGHWCKEQRYRLESQIDSIEPKLGLNDLLSLLRGAFAYEPE